MKRIVYTLACIALFGGCSSSRAPADQVPAVRTTLPPASGIFAVLDSGSKVPSRMMASPVSGESPLSIGTTAIVGFDQVADAQQGFDQVGMPVVNVVLTPKGKAAFAAATRANVGRRLAIVIGGRVLSAPTIVEPIFGGSIQISGNLTLREATDLALSLRPK